MNQNHETRRKLFDIVYRTETKDFGGYSTRDAEAVVRSLVAGGVQIPRAVSTVEELKALPIGTVILDADRVPYQNSHLSGWTGGDASNVYREGDLLTLPATVLWVPEEAE